MTEENWDTLTASVKRLGSDPAPDPQTIAAKRMKELVGQVSDAPIEQLRQLRDEVDQLIVTIQSRNEAISAAFDEHASLSVTVIKMKEIIKENVRSVRKNFEEATAPLGKTISLNK